MSRKTLSPARRGVAGLTAALVATGTLGALVVGTGNAAPSVITVTSAKVANPDAKLAKVVATALVDAKGAYDGSGNAVQIVGTGFPATPTVTFGGTAASSVLRLSDKLIIAKAPSKTDAATDAVVPLVVGEDDSVADDVEAADVTLASGYTYKAAPRLVNAKYSTDGRSLEVSGTNLKETQSLQLGALTVPVKSADATDTKVTVKVPSGLQKAKYSITATSFWGSGTLSSSWNVVPVPTAVTAATPTATTGRYATVKSADSLVPNTFVRITGTSLGGVDGVSFGYAPATFVVGSETELYVQVPAMSATQTVNTLTPNKDNVVKVPIEVRNGDLKSNKLSFEYLVAPVVTAISTTTLPVDPTVAATNTVVTVTGSNLKGVKLYFGAGAGAKSVSPQGTSSAATATYLMPKVSSNGFALGTAYDVWMVSKGGNLNTGRKLTVKAAG
ncbi:MAG: hypothetical protein JWM64_2617 [Frankiales bacterium]|nr:hypothetical protein [Frankiales bacterium]